MPVLATPPGTRFDIGVDGTQAWIKNDTEANWVDVTASIAGLYSASGANQIARAIGAVNTSVRIRLLFPEPRNILGLRWSGWSDRGFNYNLGTKYSIDATDVATAGTWNALASSGGQGLNGDSIIYVRNSIVAQAVNDVRGLEFAVNDTNGSSNWTMRFRDFHIYGQRQTTGDHVQFWHPTLDQPLSSGTMDFGDIVRGVVQGSRQFRIKNVSATKTATETTVSFNDLDGVGFAGDAGQVSVDGTTWASSVVTGSLGPGIISAIRYFRVNSLSTRAPGLAAGRIKAAVTSWTG